MGKPEDSMVVLGPDFQSLSACSFLSTGLNSAAKYSLTPKLLKRRGTGLWLPGGMITWLPFTHPTALLLQDRYSLLSLFTRQLFVEPMAGEWPLCPWL